MGTWKQKANTTTSTKIQHNESVGDSTLKEKNHLRRSHGRIGICMRKCPGLRLLLLMHSSKAYRTLTVSLRINCGGKTTSCWPNVARPTDVRAIVTVSDMWCPGAYNCHRWSSSGHSNLRHNETHYKEKKHALYKFLMAEDRKTSRIVTDDTTGRGPSKYCYTTDVWNLTHPQIYW